MKESPSGRAAAAAGAEDTSGALTIAERYPRWLAVIFTLVIAILPGLILMQKSQTFLPRGHVLAAVAYLAAAAAVSIWGCFRGWRMGLRLDDQGVTIRNYFRTYRIGWPGVRRFADGSVSGGEAGRLWALNVMLRDGRVITAAATSRGKRTARPQTLTAIEQAAGRYDIPAELTGTAMRRGSAAPANPGHYPDPGGQGGSRHWNGREWSPFLQVDPPQEVEGGKAAAEVWAPLPESAQQWHDAASQTRRAGRTFAILLTATAITLAGSLALFSWGTNHHDNYTWSSLTFYVALFLLVFTLTAWERRKNFTKIDRAAKAAAGLSDTGDHRGSRVRQVAWAMVPVVSFTILAWWPFLVLALIRRRTRDWAMFAACLAAVAAEMALLTLGAVGIIPSAGIVGEVTLLIFFALVLLVAVTAPVYTLVAFRPAAAVPSLSDAQRARAAAKRQQPVMGVGGPEGWQ
jgi:hypothetical protein